jgi:IstB-like ATP binding protein
MKSAALSRRDRLRHMLADLRIPGGLEALDAILHGVDGGTLTAPEAIEQRLAAQIQLRNNRRLQAAMRSSRLPVVKQLHDVDFTFQPSLRREQMESLHELGFVERRENVIFLGPPGVAKNASGDQSRDRRSAEWPAGLLRHAGGPDHLARRRRPLAGCRRG